MSKLVANMKKYQPSNGTEGMIFTEKHCDNCMNCDPNPEGKKQCDILMKTMCFDITDPEYPIEWTYIDGNPTCTAWAKWDWGTDGDPDDPENPNRPINDPDQLDLFPLYPNEIIKQKQIA